MCYLMLNGILGCLYCDLGSVGKDVPGLCSTALSW